MENLEQQDLQPVRQPIFSFVRRSGRLTAGQEKALADYGSKYLVEVARDTGVTSVAAAGVVDPQTWFAKPQPLTVEIGSGQGQQIVAAAEANPERNFLAVEVFRAGIARTVGLAAAANLHNLRIIEANAPEVFAKLLPAGSVSEVWVFFPDPWHKARHTKRRLINTEFVADLAQHLGSGAHVRMATDWADYAEQMRAVFDANPGFTRGFAADWAPRFQGRIRTAFERKGQQAGRDIYDLVYVKN